jgi:hypothetical protein
VNECVHSKTDAEEEMRKKCGVGEMEILKQA